MDKDPGTSASFIQMQKVNTFSSYSLSPRLDSTHSLALFSAASSRVISSVGDVFMVVGTEFI